MHKALEGLTRLRMMNYLLRCLCHRLPGSAAGYLEQDGPFFLFITVGFQESVS